MTERVEKKKKKERWPSEKLEALLDLWKDHIDGLRGVRKNSHIHQEIAADMIELNFSVSSEEVRVRIKNFTSRYRAEKNKIGPSGGSPSDWIYYDKVHSILGSFPIHNHTTEDSIFTDVEMLEDDPVQSESSSPEPAVSSRASFPEPAVSSGSSAEPAGSSSLESDAAGSLAAGSKKKKGKTSQYELLKRLDAIQFSIDEQFEYGKHQDEKLLELEKRRTDMLETFVSHTAAIKDAFIQHLNS